MPETEGSSRSVESMAFELILQKLAGLERSLASLPPLLKKIIDHMEAQSTQPEIPVATYAQLYPELQDAEETDDVLPADPLSPLPPPRRWWAWLMREVR